MMSATEILFGTGYASLAVLLALAVTLGLAVFLHLERTHGLVLQRLLFPVMGAGIAISTLTSGRNLRNASFDLSLETTGTSGLGTALLRLLTAVILGICVARIIGWWLQRQKVTQPVGGAKLFFALAAVYVTHNIFSGLLGTHPAFIHNLLYPIALFAALFIARGEPLRPVIDAAKWTLYSLMLLSLILAAVKPDMALQPGYHGWVPAITFRLWGIGSNANSIGPLALTVLLLEYMQPTRRWLIRWTAMLAATTVFILAQSKTVWVITIALLPILAWYRVPRQQRGISMGMALTMILLASGVLMGVLLFDVASIWDRFSSTQQGGEALTLTGRSQIWAVAIDEWRNNPLFGYGPEVWGIAHRQRIGMQFAFSAHNQFLQSLSSAGALGLVALIAYFGTLAFAALRAAPYTRGVSLALFVMIAARCITETPLVIATLFNGDFFVHALLVTVCLKYAGAQTPTHAQRKHINFKQVHHENFNSYLHVE